MGKGRGKRNGKESEIKGKRMRRKSIGKSKKKGRTDLILPVIIT